MNPKAARFAEEYAVDSNGTQAAIRAGYSAKTASSAADRLLRKIEVKEAIKAHQKERSRRTGIKADRVLRELARLATSNITHYEVDEKGKLRLAPGAPAEAMRAISSVKMETRTIEREGFPVILERKIEFKLWDKNAALSTITKCLGMQTDKVEVTGTVGVQVNVYLPDNGRG